jgi:hypothetical protein
VGNQGKSQNTLSRFFSLNSYPVSTEKVPSEEKGHELGIKQIASLLKQPGLEDKLTLSIGDSAYATETCRKIISTLKEHVHIARFRNNRKVFELLPVQAHSKVKPKIYEKKMTLNNPAHFCLTMRR